MLMSKVRGVDALFLLAVVVNDFAAVEGECRVGARYAIALQSAITADNALTD